MHWIDISLFILFMGVIVGVGFFTSPKSAESTENYFLAGRRLSLPGFIATLVTTWYGGILGIGENTVQFGIQSWIIFGCPYYVFAVLFAIFIVPKIRRFKLLTIPDHFNSSFGKEAGIISAVFIFILSSPAPYILSMGLLFNYVFMVPSGLGILIASALGLAYVWRGGFSAVVRTDVLQFIFMFGGFFILIITAWLNFGSPLFVIKNIPDHMLDPTGGKSIQYILVWFFIALWTFVDPGFHQRTLAADSQETARKGILISVGCWFIFDMLTLMTALYGVAMFQSPDPLTVYPELALTLLPPGLAGLFFVGIFSTILSTLDSFGLISASTFGRDIMWRIENKKERTEDPLPYIRKGLIITAFISLLLVVSIPSVVKLWYVTGSIFIPGLLIPFLYTLYFPKQRLRKPGFTLIVPVLVSLLWYIHGQVTGTYLINIEPFYPGLFFSIVLVSINKVLDGT